MVDYALISESGNKTLLAQQRFATQPNDMSHDQYSEVLRATLVQMDKSIHDNITPQLVEASQQGRIYFKHVITVNTLNYPVPPRNSRPVDYLSKMFKQ